MKMKRQSGKKIRVTFGDGMVIEEPKACDSLALAIKKIGVKRVAELGIVAIGSQNLLLLDKKSADENYSKDQSYIGDGFYLYKKTGTEKKACDLNTIAQQLNIDMKVEIVTPKPLISRNIISTTCGNLKIIKGVWMFQPNDEDKDIVWTPYTDHWTCDTLVLKHNGKYGIFTLPNMADYGNDGTLMWRGLDTEAFPYDELRIKGMTGQYYGFIAYRIGTKWGIYNFFFNRQMDCMEKGEIVPCKYPSLEEAERHFPSWRNPDGNLMPVFHDNKSEEEITENTRIHYLPRYEEFRSKRPGAMVNYKNLSIKEFKKAYEANNLKGIGNKFYDKFLQYINSLIVKN